MIIIVMMIMNMSMKKMMKSKNHLQIIINIIHQMNDTYQGQ
ncbi:hypothetical protein TNIN_488331, partial [Trichonephila inaurata madagascariensis]